MVVVEASVDCLLPFNEISIQGVEVIFLFVSKDTLFWGGVCLEGRYRTTAENIRGKRWRERQALTVPFAGTLSM